MSAIVSSSSWLRAPVGVPKREWEALTAPTDRFELLNPTWSRTCPSQSTCLKVIRLSVGEQLVADQPGNAIKVPEVAHTRAEDCARSSSPAISRAPRGLIMVQSTGIEDGSGAGGAGDNEDADNGQHGDATGVSDGLLAKVR